MSASSVAAQEVEKGWHRLFSPVPLPTERAAQVAIEQMYAQWQTAGPFEWHVERQAVFGNKTVYYYKVKPAPITRTDWVYSAEQETFESEEGVLRYLAAKSDAACPAPVIGTPEWEGIPGGGANQYPENNSGERAEITYQVNSTLQAGGCNSIQTSVIAQRTRTVACPNPLAMVWRPDLKACAQQIVPEQAEVPFTYWSGPIVRQCDAVGNPCDPTTGDKFETEVDVDLGWLVFSRHYHSLSSTSGGAFGSQWTHNHNLRLSAAMDGTAFPPSPGIQVGLIDSDGSHLAFTQVGSSYEANDGSGDRAVMQGATWTLYRSNEVVHFRADGRPATRLKEDGTWLEYGYDELGRLLTITHSTGRQLQLTYAPETSTQVTALSVNGVPFSSFTYGANAQVASVTYADGNARSYLYEDTRFPLHLTGITAEDGRRYGWYAYDAKGRVTCSRHDGDCSGTGVGVDGVRLQYGSDGTTLVTDALGKQSTYGLTPGGNNDLPRKVTGIAEAEGTVSRTYLPAASDFRRRLQSVTDRRGHTTQHAYSEGVDADAGAVAIHTATEAAGQPEQRVRVAHTATASNRIVLQYTGGQETRYVRNARLQPTSVIQRDTETNEARTTTFSYCDDEGPACPDVGLLQTIDGPRTDVADLTTFTYYLADEAGCASGTGCAFRKGDLQRVTNALGHTTEILAYSALGLPASVAESNGRTTDYLYDARGRVIQVRLRGSTPDENQVTHLTYWPTGKVAQIVQADGATLTYEYDAAQRLTDIVDGRGNSVHYMLDDAGNRLQEDTLDESAALRRTLGRAYDPLGRMTALKDARNYATSVVYDENANPVVTTDPLAKAVSRRYDALDRLAGTTRDVGGIDAQTQIHYNALDLPTRVTDPKGLHTDYGYNAFGDLLSLASPDTGVTTLTVDAAGNTLARTDARGVAATYTYDALNRMVAVVYPDPAQNINIEYDIAPAVCPAASQFNEGRIGRVTHAGGSTHYCHDRFGRLARKVQTVDGVALILAYGYNKAGRLTSMTYPDGSVVDYALDSEGRVSQVELKRPGHPRDIIARSITHAPFGPVTGWSTGTARRLDRPVDKDYRPQLIYDMGAGGLKLEFGFDAAGALTQLGVPGSTTVLASYHYDGMGRLLHSADAAGMPTHTYGWDSTGNRLQAGGTNGTDAYHYETDSHQLVSVGSLSRSYDAMGSTTSRNGQTLVNNAAGRLHQVATAAGVLATYTYNHRGERVRRQFGGNDVVTLYDESGQWLGEYLAGVPQQQIVWLDNLPIAVFGPADTGVPALAYIQPDHLGTPRAIIDPVRDVAIWRWDLEGEAFGADAANDDPDGDGVPFEFALRFPGQQFSPETGLYYNYQRDYDAQVGRYVQSDPIGLAGGITTYGYVSGRPLARVDPFGLQHHLEGFRPPSPPPRFPIRQVKKILYDHANAMQKKNWIGSDKFYHCLAMCEAASLGEEQAAIASLAGELRELNQQYRRGDPQAECDADRAANASGIKAGLRGNSCPSACDTYRPLGMPYP